MGESLQAHEQCPFSHHSNGSFEKQGLCGQALNRRPAKSGGMKEDRRVPLRICLLSYRSNPHCGGQGVYLKNLSRALRDQGHQVDVISGPPDPLLDPDIRVHRLPCLDLYNPADPFRIPSLRELSDPINLMEWMGVSTMGFPEPFTFGLRARQFLRGKFHRYDIIHDNQSLSYSLWTIGKFAPTLATIHHPITVDRKLAVQAVKAPWNKVKQMRWYSFVGMQKRVSRRLQKIITVSESAKRDISRDFRVPLEKFKVVPNGIDSELFYPVPGVEREKNRIIVTNSADTPLKGLIYLLRAVEEVSRTHDVSLTVVGTPQKDGSVVRLIRALGIGGRVTFTGRIDHGEFVKQYARVTMAVVPSLYEGFGLPAGEAMACAVPVISTTGGALPEVVGDAGLLVPTADAAALAAAIKVLLDNPQRAEAMGEAGFRRVRRLFTWERAAKITVETYRETIDDYRRLQQTAH